MHRDSIVITINVSLVCACLWDSVSLIILCTHSIVSVSFYSLLSLLDNSYTWNCRESVGPMSPLYRRSSLPVIASVFYGLLARCVGLWAAHAPEMPGTFSLPPRVIDPDMHHGTCVTHVPWYMPGSIISAFLWSRWRGKHSRHSQRLRNPQFYASVKRPMYKLQQRQFQCIKCNIVEFTTSGVLRKKLIWFDLKSSTALKCNGTFVMYHKNQDKHVPGCILY